MFTTVSVAMSFHEYARKKKTGIPRKTRNVTKNI